MRFKILLLLALTTQFCSAQVDVVYNHLVWSDEFNTDGAVNSNNWLHETKLPDGITWFNRNYCDSKRCNKQRNDVDISDITLNIIYNVDNFCSI